MALPAFALPADLTPRLPAGADVAEDRRQAALNDASAQIREAADGKTWTHLVDGEPVLDDNLPDILMTVCCKAAIRALVNPGQATQQATGPHSATFGDVYLTNTEKGMVRRAAGLGSPIAGLATVSTTRGPIETRRGLIDDGCTVYEATTYGDGGPAGQPIPWSTE